jgi:hypothetical protein
VFDPVDFVHLARALADEASAAPSQTRSARLRAAYGRLYYGVYLHVRAVLMIRHNLPERLLNHGTLQSRLQFGSSPRPLRRVGSELQRLYMLRQQADYELAPEPRWQRQLDDPALVKTLVVRALDVIAAVGELDFTPVVHLLESR